MGKTIKGKDKAAAKVARKKRKIARKAKRGVALVAFALAFLCVGCASSESAQPAKSQTLTADFEDCIIVIASTATVSNRTVRADGTHDAPTIELFTQTQSLESTGSTDSFAQTSTQTPTTDVKPDLDVRYNDAMAAASVTSKGILETLTQPGMEKVLDLMSSGGTGQVTVTKKDGTQAVVKCEDGQCTTCTDCGP